MHTSPHTKNILKTRFDDLKKIEGDTKKMQKIFEEYKKRNENAPNSFKNWITNKNQIKTSDKSRIDFKTSRIKYLKENKSTPALYENTFEPLAKLPSLLDKEITRQTLCGQCNEVPAILMCNECSEDYCSGCFGTMHSRGNMLRHSVTSIEVNSKKLQNLDKNQNKPKKDNNKHFFVNNCTQSDFDPFVVPCKDKSIETNLDNRHRPVKIRFEPSGLTYAQKLLLQKLRTQNFDGVKSKNSTHGGETELNIEEMEIFEASNDKLKFYFPPIETEEPKRSENVIVEVAPILNIPPKSCNDTENQQINENKSNEIIHRLQNTPIKKSSRPLVQITREMSDMEPKIDEQLEPRKYSFADLSQFYSPKEAPRKRNNSGKSKLSYSFYKLSPKSWSAVKSVKTENYESGEISPSLAQNQPESNSIPEARKEKNNLTTLSFSLLNCNEDVDLLSNVDSSITNSANGSIEGSSDDETAELENKLEKSIENQKLKENERFRDFMYGVINTDGSCDMGSTSSEDSYGSVTTLCPEDEVLSLK